MVGMQEDIQKSREEERELKEGETGSVEPGDDPGVDAEAPASGTEPQEEVLEDREALEAGKVVETPDEGLKPGKVVETPDEGLKPEKFAPVSQSSPPRRSRDSQVLQRAQSRTQGRPRRPQTEGHEREGVESQRSDNGPGMGQGRQRRTYFRKKVCRLCVSKMKGVDYKDADLLRKFITDRGKILPRRMTGTCAKHQRILSSAIKRARMVALLPFVKK